MANLSVSSKDHPPAMDEPATSSRAKYWHDFVNSLPANDQTLLRSIVNSSVLNDQKLAQITSPEHKPTLDPMMLLPIELITQIFEYDGLVAAMRPRQVSKLWRQTLNDPLILGKHLRTWSSDSDPLLICERAALNLPNPPSIVHWKKLEAMHRFRNGRPAKFVEVHLPFHGEPYSGPGSVAFSEDHLAFIDERCGPVLVNLMTGYSQALVPDITSYTVREVVLTPKFCLVIHDDDAMDDPALDPVSRIIDLETRKWADVRVPTDYWVQGWHCAGGYLALALKNFIYTPVSWSPLMIQVFCARSQQSQQFRVKLPDIEAAKANDPHDRISFELCSIIVDELSMMVILIILVEHYRSGKCRFDIRRFSFRDEFEACLESRVPLITKTLFGVCSLYRANESMPAIAGLPLSSSVPSNREWTSRLTQPIGEGQCRMLHLYRSRICLSINTMSYTVDTSTRSVWHRYSQQCQPLDCKNTVYYMDWTRDHALTIRPDFVATTKHDSSLKNSGMRLAGTQNDLDNATIDQILQIGVPKWENECYHCGNLDCDPNCEHKTMILGDNRFVIVLGRNLLYILAFDPDWDLTEEHFAGLVAPMSGETGREEEVLA